jgi:RNA polymerase sigma-70 factor (ECF subfamily)
MRAKVTLLKQQLQTTGSAAPTFGLTASHLKRLSDEDLMECLKQGHEDALALLFDRHYRLVLSVASKILRDPGEAEDLMQDIFFEVYRMADSFDPQRGSAKTWLLQYTYHRSLNRRKYLNARRYYDQQRLEELAVWEPSYSPQGRDGLTEQERARVIAQGLAALNEKQRQALALAYFQGLRLSEIAERMEEPLPQVRHYYYRGLKKLKAFLQDRSGGGKSLARSGRKAGYVES